MSETDLKRGRVLLMDDMPEVLRSVGRAIRRRQHLVATASSAEEALDELAGARFDLALLDIDMGRGAVNGLDCLRRVPATGHRGTVCMHTGFLSPELMHEALLSGADDYIVKCSEDNLLTEVDRLVALGGLPPERRPRYETIADPALLGSLELSADQIEILGAILRCGCPSQAELAEALGIGEKALEARLKRIRNRFGADNTTQLARYLVVLAGYVRRTQLVWGKGEVDTAPLLEGATHIERPARRGRHQTAARKRPQRRREK